MASSVSVNPCPSLPQQVWGWEKLFCGTIEERDDLPAGAVGVRAKEIASGADGDPLGHSPGYSVVVVCIRCHIVERIATGNSGSASKR